MDNHPWLGLADMNSLLLLLYLMRQGNLVCSSKRLHVVNESLSSVL